MARGRNKYFFLIVGVILMIMGVAAIMYPDITFNRSKTIKIGPVSVEEPQRKVLHVSPYAGLGIISGGIILFYIGLKK